jgi:hypothetical protein
MLNFKTEINRTGEGFFLLLNDIHADSTSQQNKVFFGVLSKLKIQ